MVVKAIFLLSPFGWLFLARCLMQLTELTYLHGLKRLFSLPASPSWMIHLRSSCWQRRCFWSCRWHCQHLNEIQCQGKHMKNVGNNTVNCVWILKNSDVSVDERCCAFFIMKRKSIFPTFLLPSVPALALKISLWPTINLAHESINAMSWYLDTVSEVNDSLVVIRLSFEIQNPSGPSSFLFSYHSTSQYRYNVHIWDPGWGR